MDNAGMNDQATATAVFVHGAGAGGWEWSVWQRVFAAHGWPVLALDLRPGASGLAATRFADYAVQVRAWCNGCSGDVALIGASLGGLLALEVAADCACRALVLINPLPPVGIEGRVEHKERGDIVPWGRGRSLRGMRRALPDADDAACLSSFRRWRDESGAVLRDVDQASIETPKCPMLVLASEHDTDCSPAASRALATRLRADFRLLPAASHAGPLLGRGAADVADETWRWLAAHLPAR